MGNVFLVKGETGSGKTELVINKAGEYIANYHRVFHVVPLNSLKFNVYSRYKVRYGDKVSPSYKYDAKIYVLTYHEYVQALVLGLNTYYDVVVFDEFHVITEDIFRPVVYASVVNTKKFYHMYFISATPVDLPFVKFDEVIELSGRRSVYKLVKVEKSRYIDVVLKEYKQGHRGFIYVGGVENTKNVATEVADLLPP
jgi:superfamily II DNA or RNA helicase